MALKGKPVAIGNTATTIYTCPATKEAAVHGLLFGNNTASALAVDVIVYNQATGSDITVVTDLAVPANGIATWSKPINLNAGDAVKAVSSAASGMVCLYSTYEDGATPVASGFTARGAWSSAATYVANDIVSVSGSGTYVAIQGSTNQDPTTATAYWMFLEGISASALPAQSGNSGKYLTTDGTTASWGELDVAGNATISDITADLTLTSASSIVQIIRPDADGYVVKLPSCTSLSKGRSFAIANKSKYTFEIQDFDGNLLTLCQPKAIFNFNLIDNTTSAGDWEAVKSDLASSVSVTGEIRTGSSTYTSFALAFAGEDATNRYFRIKSSYQTTAGNHYAYYLAHNKSTSIWSQLNYAQNSKPYYGYPYYDCAAGSDHMLDNGTMFNACDEQSNPVTALLVGYIDASSSQVSYHTFNTGASNNYHVPSAVNVGNNKVLIASSSYVSSNTTDYQVPLYFQVVDLSGYPSSGTFSSAGSAVTFTPSGNTYQSGEGMGASYVQDGKGIVGFRSNVTTSDYTSSGKPSAMVVTISGTTPSLGSAAIYSTTDTPSNGLAYGGSVQVCTFDSTYFLLTWVDPVNYKLYGTLGSISGTSITYGNPVYLLSSGTTQNAMYQMSRGSNKIGLVYQNTSDLKAPYFIEITFDSGTGELFATLDDKISVRQNTGQGSQAICFDDDGNPYFMTRDSSASYTLSGVKGGM